MNKLLLSILFLFSAVTFGLQGAAPDELSTLDKLEIKDAARLILWVEDTVVEYHKLKSKLESLEVLEKLLVCYVAKLGKEKKTREERLAATAQWLEERRREYEREQQREQEEVQHRSLIERLNARTAELNQLSFDLKK